MLITVDGGALCGNPNHLFGTHTVTSDILHTISLLDKKNKYYVYTFCNFDFKSYVSQSITFNKVTPSFGWMKWRIPLEELRLRPDIFLSLNQSLPLYTPAKKIVISHGLSFLKYPLLYKNDYKRLSAQFRDYIHHGDKIIVSSTRVKEEMIEMFPHVKNKLHTIPFGVPSYFANNIFRGNNNAKVKDRYFLHVGSGQEIKNIPFLLEVFDSWKKKTNLANFSLKLVGLGRNAIRRKDVHVYDYMTHDKLIHLYRGATAYITVSQYESFNFPVVEALSQGCSVIGLKNAIIPEMHKYVHVCETKNNLIDSLSNIIDNTISPNIPQRVCSHFSWERFVKKLILIYNK